MTNTRKRRPPRGFTLVEMLVVLAILVLLVSMVVPRVIGSRKKADISNTRIQIGAISKALDAYEMDCKKFPTTEQGLAALAQKPADLTESTNWSGPYLTGEVPKDPWGNDYQYAYPPERGSGDNPDIWSYGPDGEDNTEDDICSWTGGSGGRRGGDQDTVKERPAETRREPRTDSRTEPRRESTTPKRSSGRSTTPRTETKPSSSL